MREGVVLKKGRQEDVVQGEEYEERGRGEREQNDPRSYVLHNGVFSFCISNLQP